MAMDEVRPRSTWKILQSAIFYIDWWLILLLALLMGFSLVILNSAAESGGTVLRQAIRFAAAWGLFGLFLCLPAGKIRQITPVVYAFTLILLLLVLLMGSHAGGAQRWLNIGIARIQPSELAKLSVPMMVAWYLTRQARPPNLFTVLISLVIIAVPAYMILDQPDLGTALLVAASGIIALFLAGLPWWLIGVGAVMAAIALPLFWMFGIKAYQRERVLTLFNPEADPFDAGYHIIQSQIAIGSGGVFGKGYGEGTQSQLSFLPESTTDFVFSVIAEELGLFGVSLLLLAYLLLILRGLYLSTRLNNRFARILVAAIFLSFFINIFVNIGMVSGFLPVVGLPLALISYGGSSVLSLMAGFAIAVNLIGGYKQSPKQEHFS